MYTWSQHTFIEQSVCIWKVCRCVWQNMYEMHEVQNLMIKLQQDLHDCHAPFARCRAGHVWNTCRAGHVWNTCRAHLGHMQALPWSWAVPYIFAWIWCECYLGAELYRICSVKTLIVHTCMHIEKEKKATFENYLWI